MENIAVAQAELSEMEADAAADGGDARAPRFERESGAAARSGAGAARFTADDAVELLGFSYFQVRLLFIAGFVFAADACAMILLSFLIPSVRCAFALGETATAAVATVVFIGMLNGAAVFGRVSDNYGRRRAFLVVALITFPAALVAAVAPNIWALYACLFVLGTGVGGAHVGFTLFAEFLPAAKRGTWLIMISMFWCAGTVSEGLLAWIILPRYEQDVAWRYLVAATAVPLAPLIVLYYFLPESPRWLLARGRCEEARAIFAWAARCNNVVIPAHKLHALGADSAEAEAAAAAAVAARGGDAGGGELVVLESEADEPAAAAAGGAKKGGVSDLFNATLRRTTLLLWLIWFANTTVYYGILLLTPNLFAKHHDAEEEVIGVGTGHGHVPPGGALCEKFTDEDYNDVFITSVGEVPGILLTIWLINVIGRKRTMGVEFVGVGLCLFFISMRTTRFAETLCLFMVRAFISGSFQAGWLYTGEIYPTFVRSTGLGMSSSVARLGGMVTPFIAQGLADYSLSLALGVYGSLAVAAGIACGLLPIETHGIGLIDSLQEFAERAAGRNALVSAELSAKAARFKAKLRRKIRARNTPRRTAGRARYNRMVNRFDDNHLA